MVEVVATSELWTNPIVVGLVVGLPTFFFGFVAYRRTEKLDQAAAQAAMIASEGNAVQRVIDGLDRMVDNLQTDNKVVRQRAADLSERLKECQAALARMAAAGGLPPSE